MYKLLLPLSCIAYALATPVDINRLYAQWDHTTSQDAEIRAISALFLKSPYEAFLLGEGNHAVLVHKPLYRLDKFDCQTFVESVLALYRTPDIQHFTETYKSIKYHNNDYRFVGRNHFTSIQWNTNAHAQALTQDITHKLSSNATYQHTCIDIPAWYEKLATNDTVWMHYSNAHLTPETQQLLRTYAKTSTATLSKLSYLPSKHLLDANGHIQSSIYAKLPATSIVEIVRHHWPNKNLLGTELDISHMGLLLKHNNTLILRHASEREGKVVDIDFARYVQSLQTQASFAGIHVEAILTKRDKKRQEHRVV